MVEVTHQLLLLEKSGAYFAFTCSRSTVSDCQGFILFVKLKTVVGFSLL